MDSIGQERAEVWVPFADQRPKESAGALAVGAVEVERAGAQEAVGVGDPELEAGAGLERAAAPELRLTVAVGPQQHEVDEVGHVEPGADPLIAVPVGAGALPGVEVGRLRGADDKIVGHVVVAHDCPVVVARSTQVVGEEALREEFPAVVLPPVGPVDVHVHEAAMGIEAAHVEKAVLDEAAGHVEAALGHVVRAGSQVELVEGADRSRPVVETVEQWRSDGVVAVSVAAFDPEAALVERGPGVAEARETAVDVHRRPTVGPEDLEGPRLLLVIGLPGQRQCDGGDRSQAGSESCGQRGILGDRAVHRRRGDHTLDEHEGARLHRGGPGAGADRTGADGHRSRHIEAVGVDEARLGPVSRIEDGRTGIGGGEQQAEGTLVESPVVAPVGLADPALVGCSHVRAARRRVEHPPIAGQITAVGEVIAERGIVHPLQRFARGGRRDEQQGAAGPGQPEAHVQVA